MSARRFSATAAASILALLALTALLSAADETKTDGKDVAAKGKPQPQWRSLFDGKTLAGWDGDPDLWSVEDGCITGTTTKEKPPVVLCTGSAPRSFSSSCSGRL